LNRKQWEEVQEVVHKALKLNRLERTAFLRQSMEGKQTLLSESNSMLRAAEDGDDFLEKPLLPQCLSLMNREDGQPPATIGPYTILKCLGEGGMGAVYLAERDGEKVALKVIRPGMDSREILLRFGAECKMLGKMDHPHIARIFQAGRTNEGQPFFTMEYLDGQPINRFCQDQVPGLEHRLRLFLQVCEGVRHAHEKGVIHRDIKPSNLIVTGKQRPVVKIIDFGIAKAMEQSKTDPSVPLTVQGQIMGTPAYLSPEQATGEALDPRTDIYALGAVLYELLAGEPPHGWGRETSFYEVVRRIMEERPKPPGTVRATKNGPSRPHYISKDLDCIVLKALARDRDQRYQTVAALVRDIHNYLEQRPVEARKTVKGQQMKHIMNRCRTTVAACVFAISTLLLGMHIGAQTPKTETLALEESRKESPQFSRNLNVPVFWNEILRYHAGLRSTAGMECGSYEEEVNNVCSALCEQCAPSGQHHRLRAFCRCLCPFLPVAWL